VCVFILSEVEVPEEENSVQPPVGQIPTPPPLPPLPPPPPLLVPYVFRPQFSPEKVKPPEKMKESPPKTQYVKSESSSIAMSDGAFVITFVAGTPESKPKFSNNLQSHSSGPNNTEEKSKEKVLTHKEKLEMEQEILRKRRESVRNSWEEKWVYRGPLESALYSKIHDFKKQRVERGYTDVLKKADDFLASPSATSISDSDTDKEEGTARSGNVSNRLKMFGGAASFLKPSLTKDTKSDQREHKEKQQQVDDNSETENKEETDGHPIKSELRQGDGEALDNKFMLLGSSRRRSSSCVSINAFATIEEEGENNNNNNNTNNNINESIESLDKVSPLPKIGPSRSRRQSMELLRLDGIVKNDGEPTMIREKDKASRKGSTSSLGESALLYSTSTASGDKTEAAFSIDPKTAYLNSANLPHINRERDECEYQELEKVKDALSSLISMPQWAGSVRVKFKGLNVDDMPKVQIWQFNVSPANLHERQNELIIITLFFNVL